MQTRTFGVLVTLGSAVTIAWEGFHGAGGTLALQREVITGASFLLSFGNFLVGRSFSAPPNGLKVFLWFG